jgi:hypothetical protein
MAAVGADAAAVEGMRVVATEAGRSWDMNKGKRGDPSGGASGSIVEVREGGKVMLAFMLACPRGCPCAGGLELNACELPLAPPPRYLFPRVTVVHGAVGPRR